MEIHLSSKLFVLSNSCFSVGFLLKNFYLKSFFRCSSKSLCKKKKEKQNWFKYRNKKCLKLEFQHLQSFHLILLYICILVWLSSKSFDKCYLRDAIWFTLSSQKELRVPAVCELVHVNLPMWMCWVGGLDPNYAFQLLNY